MDEQNVPELPIEIWSRIFTYADGVSLLALSCVCVNFKSILDDEHRYWEPVVKNYERTLIRHFSSTIMLPKRNDKSLWSHPPTTKQYFIALASIIYASFESDPSNERKFLKILKKLGSLHRHLTQSSRLSTLQTVLNEEVDKLRRPGIPTIVCCIPIPGRSLKARWQSTWNFNKNVHLFMPLHSELTVDSFCWNIPRPSDGSSNVETSSSIRNLTLVVRQLTGNCGSLTLDNCAIENVGGKIAIAPEAELVAVHTAFTAGGINIQGSATFDACSITCLVVKIDPGSSLSVVRCRQLRTAFHVSENFKFLNISDTVCDAMPLPLHPFPSETFRYMLTRAEKEKTKSREFAGLLNSIAFFSRQITAEVKFDARAIGQICELVWYGLKEHLNNEDVARGCCHLLIILPHMCKCREFSKQKHEVMSCIYSILSNFRNSKSTVESALAVLFNLCGDITNEPTPEKERWRIAASCKPEYIKILVELARQYKNMVKFCSRIIAFLWIISEGSSSTSLSAREAIFANGGAELFVELIQHNSTYVTQIALNALIYINISEHNRELFVKHGGVEALSNLLKSTETQLLVSTTQFLRAFFYANEHIAPEFYTQGVVAELIRIVSDPTISFDVKEQASAAIANFASSSEENKKLLIESGVLLPLLRLVQMARLEPDGSRVLLGTIIALCHLSSQVSLSLEHLAEIERFWRIETSMPGVLFSPNDVRFVLHTSEEVVLMMGLWCIAVIQLEEPIAGNELKWSIVANKLAPFIKSVLEEKDDSGESARKKAIAKEAVRKLSTFGAHISTNPQSGH